MDSGVVSIDESFSSNDNATVNSNLPRRTLLALLVFQHLHNPEYMRSIHVYSSDADVDSEEISYFDEEGSREGGLMSIIMQQEFLFQRALSSSSDSNMISNIPLLLSPPTANSFNLYYPTREGDCIQGGVAKWATPLAQQLAMLKHIHEDENGEGIVGNGQCAIYDNPYPYPNQWRCVLQYCADTPFETTITLPSLLPSQNPAMENCPFLSNDLTVIENTIESLQMPRVSEDILHPIYNNINNGSMQGSSEVEAAISSIMMIDGAIEKENFLIQLPFDADIEDISLEEAFQVRGEKTLNNSIIDQNMWQDIENLPSPTDYIMQQEEQSKHLNLLSYNTDCLSHDPTISISTTLVSQMMNGFNSWPDMVENSSLISRCLHMEARSDNSIDQLPYLQEMSSSHDPEDLNIFQSSSMTNRKGLSTTLSFNEGNSRGCVSPAPNLVQSPSSVMLDCEMLFGTEDLDCYFSLDQSHLNIEMQDASMSVLSDDSVGTGVPKPSSLFIPPFSELNREAFIMLEGGLEEMVESPSIISNRTYSKGRSSSCRRVHTTKHTTTTPNTNKTNSPANRGPQRGTSERITEISLAELSQYFNMPITQASKELKVGLTVLKKRCREFGIPRWPHRKMKSLDSLIHNIQDLAAGDGEKPSARVLNAVKELEEQKRRMEEMPAIELAERTKRLRQACFKASYKKRRQTTQHSTLPHPLPPPLNSPSSHHLSSSVSSSSDQYNSSSSFSYASL